MKEYSLFRVGVSNLHALKEIENVFNSGFINEGVQVTELTQALQVKLGSKQLLLTNSCTSALTLALQLSGVGFGDDVVSTPMTCVATNTPIVNLGANIVWTDINPHSGMPEPEMIEAKITPKTKAVVVVAWGGTPPDLISVQNICKKHSIKLILDAAHAFGALFEGKPVSEFVDFTCYSFQAIKHFTTGDGGALVCSDNEMFDRAKALKWFGLDRDKSKDEVGNWKGQQWDVDITEVGWKHNMNNVSAAIGLANLWRIDGIIDAHRQNATIYDVTLRNVNPLIRHPKALSSHWVYGITLSDNSPITRDELLQKLNSEGIKAGVVHVPNDTYTCFNKFKADLPGVRQFSKQQLCLPVGWWLKSKDIEHIARRVIELCR